MMLGTRATMLALTATLLLISATLAEEHNKPPEGFEAVFNGRDLAGWHGMGHFDPRQLSAMSDEDRAEKRATDLEDVKKHWTVEDGELVNDGHGVYLTTDQEFGDMEFWIDYKTVALADSGIYLRATPQVQIWDFTEAGGKWNIGADKGSGGLWNNSAGAPGKDPLVLADKPFGEWNRFRIIQVGERTTVYLNDKLVVDHAPLENFWTKRGPEEWMKEKPGAWNTARPLLREGPIQLQTHGGEIRWRNVFVREIPADEANSRLASKGDDGFKTIVGIRHPRLTEYPLLDPPYALSDSRRVTSFRDVSVLDPSICPAAGRRQCFS